MNKALHYFTVLLLPVVAGCHYYFPNALPAGSTTGQIIVEGRFPRRLSTQIIPGDTVRIDVRVTGENVPAGSVLTAALSPTTPKVTFVDVPAGLKNVKATAFDNTDNQLAAGTTDVTIIAGTTVTATVTLQLTTDAGRFNLIIQ